MKILVIDNEWPIFKVAFASLNLIDYNDEAVIDYCLRSQDVKNFENFNRYDYIFVDIDLSEKSRLDGFGIIERMLSKEPKPRVIIFTGNTIISSKIKNEEIAKMPILKKPISFKSIRHAIEEAKAFYEEE